MYNKCMYGAVYIRSIDQRALLLLLLHVCKCARVLHTHSHTQIYALAHSRARTHTHTRIHMHAFSAIWSTDTYAHTPHTHTLTHTHHTHTHIHTHTTRTHINICMTSIYSSLAHFVLLPEVLLPPTQALSQSLSVRLQTCMLWERLSTPLLRHGVAVTKNDQFSPSVWISLRLGVPARTHIHFHTHTPTHTHT